MSQFIDWVDYKKGVPIENKIVGGSQEYGTIFVARMRFPDGNVHPGKYVVYSNNRLVDAGYAGIDGKEIKFSHAGFQIATGDEKSFKWVDQSGPFSKLSVLAKGGIPVDSGFVRINDGYDYKPLYVARAHISNKGKRIGKICGEVSEGALALVPYGNRQHESTEYQVLVYTGPLLPLPPSSLPKPPSEFPTGFPNPTFPFPFPTEESTGLPKPPFPLPVDESTGIPKSPFPFPIDESTGIPSGPPFPSPDVGM